MFQQYVSYLGQKERALICMLALAAPVLLFLLVPVSFSTGEKGVLYTTASLENAERFSLTQRKPGMRVQAFLVFFDDRKVCALWQYWQNCLSEEDGQVVSSFFAIGRTAPFVSEVKSTASPSQARLFRHILG